MQPWLLCFSVQSAIQHWSQTFFLQQRSLDWSSKMYTRAKMKYLLNAFKQLQNLQLCVFKKHYFAKIYIMFYVIYKSGVDTVASLKMRCSRTMWWLILLVVLGSGVSSECNLASNHIWRESWINLLTFLWCWTFLEYKWKCAIWG